MRYSGDHCDDLLGAYVLGACPEPEAELVAEHPADCTDCAREAVPLRAGAGELLADVTPVAPATAVRDRLMAQVRDEAALFDAARRRAEDAPEPVAKPRRSFLTRLRVPVPVAAVACALVLTVGAGALLTGSHSSSRTTLTAQVTDKRAPGATGTLDISDSKAQLRVAGLRDPGPGRVYQVWVRSDREVPRPSGATFRVDARGQGHTSLPGNMKGVDQVLVTSEPAGGSPLPTRVPVLQVDTAA